MDLVSIETGKEGTTKAILKFPQLYLVSRIQLMQSSVDAVISGEAILRFLDVQLILHALVQEGSLKEAEVTLDTDTVTTAFDLDIRDLATSRRLQMALRAKKEEIVDLLKGMLEKKIAGSTMKSVGHEDLTVGSTALAVNIESSVQKANRFVDQILRDNRKALQEAIAHVHLPDEYIKFSKKILFVETHGFVRLQKGVLHNLHAISRKGDCVIFAEDDVLNVVIDLGLDNVLGGYLIDVGFGYFGATSDLKLKIESVELIIKGLHSFRTISDQDDKERDNLFDFDLALNVRANIGDIDIDVNIATVIDWLVNFIAEKVVGILKGRLQGMIKDPIKQGIISIMNGSF